MFHSAVVRRGQLKDGKCILRRGGGLAGPALLRDDATRWDGGEEYVPDLISFEFPKNARTPGRRHTPREKPKKKSENGIWFSIRHRTHQFPSSSRELKQRLFVNVGICLHAPEYLCSAPLRPLLARNQSDPNRSLARAALCRSHRSRHRSSATLGRLFLKSKILFSCQVARCQVQLPTRAIGPDQIRSVWVGFRCGAVRYAVRFGNHKIQDSGSRRNGSARPGKVLVKVGLSFRI